MAMDIAIIGIGLHPFGRHDGVSALEMGVAAATEALRDAGVAWNDIDLACSGSLEVLQPDTMAVLQQRLSDAGFSRVYQWYQGFSFISLIAFK